MTRDSKRRESMNCERELEESTTQVGTNSIHIKRLSSGRVRVRRLADVRRDREMLEEMERRNLPWLRGDR